MGAYLPKDELGKFLNQPPGAAGSGQGAHAAHKLTESNLGHQMLKQQGWQEGQGLGAGGVVNPVEAQSGGGAGPGTGVGAGSDASAGTEESEFDQYRKRMQLAYRFRPNPMNNPRRDYY
jgi:splicing factor 4